MRRLLQFAADLRIPPTHEGKGLRGVQKRELQLLLVLLLMPLLLLPQLLLLMLQQQQRLPFLGVPQRSRAFLRCCRRRQPDQQQQLLLASQFVAVGGAAAAAAAKSSMLQQQQPEALRLMAQLWREGSEKRVFRYHFVLCFHCCCCCCTR